MATPSSTPMKHAPSQGRTPSQSQHGAAATPPVSTPFSTSAAAAAFSPHGPRSSPQQFKRSPATSATLLGHPSNGPVNFDSPSAAAALGALGLGDISLDAVAVNGLGPLNPLGRVDDDERARRLDAVIDVLNKASKGVVSEASLERLAKRIGLECLWEDGMGVDSKSRTLIIAGSVLALDIVLSNNMVQSVSLAFPESSEMVAKHADRAAKILLDDLQLRPNQSPLTKRLDGFAANLERLAALDKLSVLPNLNLYEAMAGMYESLQRLCDWETSKLRAAEPALAAKGETAVVNRVLCKGSGCPRMHAADRVGLSLDYWVEGRLVPQPMPSAEPNAPAAKKSWAVLVGCAPLLHGVGVTPVRVSDKWISAEVEKLNDPTDEEFILTTGPVTDWLEPDSTFLPLDIEAKADPTAQLEAELLPKLPDAMFVATFDPPVILPENVWQQMHHVVGVAAASEFGRTYDILLFPLEPGAHYEPSEPRTITTTRKVPVVGLEGERSVRTHRNSLFSYTRVFGRTLEQVPFSHPRQLVAMLPYLRQYVFLASLLQTTFKEQPKPSAMAPRNANGSGTAAETMRDEFRAFMDDEQSDTSAAAPPPVSIDVTLTAHSVPRLQIVFPFRTGVANILLEIRPDAEVHIVSENITDGGLDDPTDKGKGKERTRSPETLARVLEICEDLGRWCEWIRTRW